MTIDVNALWATITSAPVVPFPTSKPTNTSADKENLPTSQTPTGSKSDKSTITIKRTYTLAGKTHTETKTVPRDSVEARLYLAINPSFTNAPDTADDAAAQPFRSAFEPLSLSFGADGAGRADLNLGLANMVRAREEAAKAEAKKLNTVQKSKLDWAQYVSAEGTREELDLAGRKRGNWNNNSGFLAGAEGREDDAAWRVRLAGK